MYKYHGTSPSGCVVALLALILIVPYACGGSVLLPDLQDGVLIPPTGFLMAGAPLFGLPLAFVLTVIFLSTFARGRIMIAILAALAVSAVVVLGIYGIYYAVVSAKRPPADVLLSLAPACQQQAVPAAEAYDAQGSSTLHTVLLNESGESHRWTGKLPQEWKPLTVGDAELVACVTSKPEKIQIERCTYILGPSITRYKESVTVTIISPKTAYMVASFAVEDVPRKCMSSEKKEVTELRGNLTFDAVLARLQTYVAR